MRPNAGSRFGSSIVLAALLIAAAVARAADVVPEAEPRYYVQFDRLDAGSRRLIEDAGGKPAVELGEFGAISARLSPDALERLKLDPRIRSIEEDPRRFPMAEVTPYGIAMVQAPQVEEGYGAPSRKVCIIDSGYYKRHVDVDQHVTGSTNTGTGTWSTDHCGHGTHVAGTIAAVTNAEGVRGVLPNGTIAIHVVKVFGDDCDWAYSSDLVAALGRCRAAGANVVSMSLGGGSSSTYERQAFDDAYAKGILSIAAAGNDGSTRHSYPASYASVVSVAAVDSTKKVASFSQRNSQVEISAPGVGILSTVPWTSENTLTTGTSSAPVTFAGNRLENAPAAGSATGTLANGGLCAPSASYPRGAVVLCKRGTYSLADKVRSVQKGGGKAAVIYNNVPGLFGGTLGDDPGVTISAIALSQEDGQKALGYAGKQATAVSLYDPAPGSGYEAWDGTSMATPHVSGVAALVWSRKPAATNRQIRDALDASATDLGTAGRDTSYGWGLVQAKRALDVLNGTVTPRCRLVKQSCSSSSRCCSGTCSSGVCK